MLAGLFRSGTRALPIRSEPVALQNQFWLAARLWYAPLQMVDSKRERRSGQRLPARVPVSIKAQGGNLEASGFTRDLNTGGIFLYTDSRIVEGSELEVVLILPPELTHGAKQWVCC